MRHAVIMAGGAGTRLWPLSRKTRPKQLLPLFGGKSLLRQSYERVAAVLPPESIYVITAEGHIHLIADELPELPRENLFGEPVGRDTANAVGMAAAILHARDPDGVMGVFTADHLIRPMDRFRAAVDSAYTVADEHPDALVTMGIQPSSVQTSFGYVERGDQVSDGVYQVKRFIEKPSLAEATEYVEGGQHYWNSGMFTWRIKTILAKLKELLPHSYDGLMEIGRVWDTDAGLDKAKTIYPDLQKISIDFAIMERADQVLVVEMTCEWADVGSWTSLESVLGTDPAGNVQAALKVINLGSSGNVIVSEEDHLIATIGVTDLVIVHSPDATLVCSKRDAQGLKELVSKIHSTFGETYL